jgi:hypothetical protein
MAAAAIAMNTKISAAQRHAPPGKPPLFVREKPRVTIMRGD